MEGSTLYRDLAYVFVAAVLGGMVAKRLRQPLILGYVAGGILIGRFTPGPTLGDIHALELFAEIGVILLMYSVGLEFSFRELLRVKWVALLGGPAGILASIGVSMLLGTFLGWSTAQSVVIGSVISVASTMVLSRLLIDRGELLTQHGRVMFSITLVEDLAVVMLTVLLPVMADPQGSAQAALLAIGKALLVLVPVTLLAARFAPRILARVARAQSQELYLLVALALGLATAAVTQAIGLSLALGAFLAGVVISESEYAEETMAQMLPLRDAFVALFFVTMGALIDPQAIVTSPGLLGILIALVLVGKLVIWTGVVKLFGYPIWTALLVGVGLTQIGEFSFILVQVGRTHGLIGSDVYNATLAASLITIMANAFLMRAAPRLLGQFRIAKGAGEQAGPQEPALKEHVVICGFGRIGGAVGTALDAFQVPYAVIEADPDIVKDLRTRGIHAVFGTPEHRLVLEHAGTARCRLVVISIPDKDRSIRAIRTVRSLNREVPILARAHRAKDTEDLTAAGASEVILPELEGSVSLIRLGLRYLELPDAETEGYVENFRLGILTGALPRGTDKTSPVVVREVPLGELFSSQTLGNARIRERFGVTVVAVRKKSGELLVNPSADTWLGAGDRVRVFGLPEQVQRYVEELRSLPQRV